MLKTTRLFNEPIFCKNNNSKPASKKNNNDGKFNKFDVDNNKVKHAKK